MVNWVKQQLLVLISLVSPQVRGLMVSVTTKGPSPLTLTPAPKYASMDSWNLDYKLSHLTGTRDKIKVVLLTKRIEV